MKIGGAICTVYITTALSAFAKSSHHLYNNIMASKRQISADEVAQLIAQDEVVIIHEGYALQLGEWINNHPGGKIAILHMVGRDATDEINV